jgi:hypothetical protein
MKNSKQLVLEEKEKGNIVIANADGLLKVPLKEFIQQPIEELLYDLNRNELTVLAFIEDYKWINDFAVCQVIRALKLKIEELESKINNK